MLELAEADAEADAEAGAEAGAEVDARCTAAPDTSSILDISPEDNQPISRYVPCWDLWIAALAE